MKSKSLTTLLSVSTSLALAHIGSHQLSAQSLEITGALLETVGTVRTVPGAGTADNTTTWAPGVVGQFAMTNGFFMQVSATAPTGSLSSGTDSLMVIRTTNSQTLVDTATLTMLVRPSSSADFTLDVNFSFFSDSGFTTPASVTDLLLTSLDIDFNQRYYTQTGDFDNNFLYAPTNIVAAPIISGYDGFTSGGSAQFNDGAYAVSSQGTGSEFNVKVGHNGNALYMFEFRNPSSIIPEPSTSAFFAVTALGMGLYRRRRNK